MKDIRIGETKLSHTYSTHDALLDRKQFSMTATGSSSGDDGDGEKHHGGNGASIAIQASLLFSSVGGGEPSSVKSFFCCASGLGGSAAGLAVCRLLGEVGSFMALPA